MAKNKLDDIIAEQTPRLKSFVRSRVSNPEDAEDIVQDTFYQFVRTINLLDNPIGQVTSWLYTVARNLVINHGKKHREAEMPQRRYQNDDADIMGDFSEIMIAPETEGPEIQMLRNMVWEELDKAMAELPDEQRAAIEMTEIQGMTVREAAQQMGVSQGTFLSRKHYAVVHIRKRMQKLYEEISNP